MTGIPGFKNTGQDRALVNQTNNAGTNLPDQIMGAEHKGSVGVTGDSGATRNQEVSDKDAKKEIKKGETKQKVRHRRQHVSRDRTRFQYHVELYVLLGLFGSVMSRP